MSRSDKNPFKLTEDDILNVFTFLGNENPAETRQANMNFLSTRSSSSSALDALQSYGLATHSPSWNINNPELTLASSDAASCKPFNNLNLNSIEEEDEFLYGDSNSIPDADTSVKEDPVPRSTFKLDISRHEAGWSDEEDAYNENSGTSLNKLNSRLRRNLSDHDSQNKTQEIVKFPHVKRDETFVEDSASLVKIPEQKYRLHKLNSDSSVLSPKGEINQFRVSETSSDLYKDKSKYHVAAEILKKKGTLEKNLLSSSNEKLDTFPVTSKSLSKPDSKSVHADIKTDKPSLKFQRQTPRTLNKKHIENIKDYITGPQRKRVHPHEELGSEKHPRYESSRNFSPSRHHSPQRSSLSSYKHKSSFVSESDHTKYPSPYSRHRSPSFEYEKRHSRYLESYRRHSPSPKRWSHGKSPDYRHRDRSPRSRRSRSKSPKRSRSPGNYSSRCKTYDKKKLLKSPKKSDSYSKKKGKSRNTSADSFCSLSLGTSSSSSSSSSTSSSSDSSDESSGEKKKSKKSSSKTVVKDNRKVDNDSVNLTNSADAYSKKLDGESKQISNPVNENAFHLVNPLSPEGNLRLLQFLGMQQQPIAASHPSTFSSPTVTDINIASNLQMPVISSSESYAYPAAPIQYVSSQVPNYPQMMPSATFPAPIMAPAHATQYGPYLPVPPTPSFDSQYITSVVPKSGKIRPSTLRTIPVADSLHASNALSSNITIVPNDTSLQKSTKSSYETKTKPEASKSSQKSKLSVEKKTKNVMEREIEKNVNSTFRSSKLSGESMSEQNKLLTIEKYKKLKAERAFSQSVSKNAATDLDDMRRTLDNNFGKKVKPDLKIIYSRCKIQFNSFLDMASKCHKDARHLDEELYKFKTKLPTDIQEELSKIKLEDCKEESVSDEIYSCLDRGNHNCPDCYVQFDNVKDMFQHLQTSEHKQEIETSDSEWKKDFLKEQNEKTDSKKKSVVESIKGVEFLKPITGFYCTLCKEVVLEELSAEQHVKGHQHYLNYMNYIKKYPRYESVSAAKCYAILKNKELDTKMEIVNENTETTHRNEIKTNESKLTEDSKDIHSDGSSDDNLSDIQKILSGKKIKDDLNVKPNNCKTVHKYVFIGKNPSYKKKIAERSKPWYKRESILNKSEKNSHLALLSSLSKISKNFLKKDKNPPVSANNDSTSAKQSK